MRTAVIVPTAGRMAKLARCLDGLYDMDEAPDEVIVVFQGPEDRAMTDAVRARHPDTVVVWASKRGAAAARNAGAARTHADLLLFVDDDCVVHPRWLGCYRSAFAEDERLMFASGRVSPLDGGHVASVGVGLQLGSVPRLFDQLANPVGTVDRSGNLAVRRSAFAALGGFDEGLGAGTAFPSAEDTDFVYRAMRAGFRLRYLPDAAVDHDQWRSGSEASALERGYAIGLGAFLITHVRRGDAYAAGLVGRLAWHLGVRPLVVGIVQRRPDRRRSGWHYLLGIPMGMARGIRRPAEHHAGRAEDVPTGRR